MAEVLPPLNGTEIVVFAENVGNAELFQAAGVPVTTTQDIANLANGALSVQVIVQSGTSYTTGTSGIFVGWNSATSGNKTTAIPESVGNLRTIIISDLAGTAYAHPITAVPVSGSIVGPASVYTDYGSITLLDTAAGWVSI